MLEYLMLLYVNSLFTDGSSELSKELSTFSGKFHVLVSSFNHSHIPLQSRYFGGICLLAVFDFVGTTTVVHSIQTSFFSFGISESCNHHFLEAIGEYSMAFKEVPNQVSPYRSGRKKGQGLLLVQLKTLIGFCYTELVLRQ